MTRLYLDTHIWSYLFGQKADLDPSDLDAVRRRLLVEVRTRRIIVLGGVPVLQELTPLFGTDLYPVIVDFMFRAVGKNWLLPLKEMHDAELRHGGGLTGRGPFVTGRVRRALRRLVGDRDGVAAIAAETKRLTEEFRVQQAAAEAHIRKELLTRNDGEPVDVLTLMREWWENRDVAGWVGDLVDSGVERGVLAGGEVEASAGRVPTAWHFTSFKLARMRMNLGEGESVKPSDLIDAEHYAAAAYGDVLVTDDQKFQRSAKLLDDDRPFAVETFEDLLTRLR